MEGLTVSQWFRSLTNRQIHQMIPVLLRRWKQTNPETWEWYADEYDRAFTELERRGLTP